MQTPISGDDIAKRPTFAEVERQDMNSSILTVPVESMISTVVADRNIDQNVGHNVD